MSSPSTPRPTPTTSWCASPSRTAGRRRQKLHLLPTLWFRNTWSWGRDGEGYWPEPSLRRTGATRIEADHASLGRYVLEAEPVAGGPAPELLFTDNETNTERLFGAPNTRP